MCHISMSAACAAPASFPLPVVYWTASSARKKGRQRKEYEDKIMSFSYFFMSCLPFYFGRFVVFFLECVSVPDPSCLRLFQSPRNCEKPIGDSLVQTSTNDTQPVEDKYAERLN